MRVLDLFSGLGGWAAPFRDRGYDVTTVDVVEAFHPDICANVLDLGPYLGAYDVVLASPPCEAFSVASIGTHWGGGMRAYEPQTPQAHTALALVHWTVAAIEAMRPRVAIIENPRGMLRKLGVLDRYERVTVTYCQYGDTSMKPTDLWGLPFPDKWAPLAMCRNGASCHERAPRGARTGTQGKQGSAARAEIPYPLALSVLEAIEA
jgi:hypothetical protein